MKTKLYFLLITALLFFQYSYSKTWTLVSTTINDTIVLKSKEHIIADTILLENMLAVRITTTRRDSLLIVDTTRQHKTVTVSHSRVLREALTIDTIPVLQQASGMAVMNKIPLVAPTAMKHGAVAKQYKRKTLERLKVIAPPTIQSSYQETKSVAAKLNKQEEKTKKEESKEQKKQAQITIAKPKQRPLMSYYSILEGIRKKRIEEALGIYPIHLPASTYLPETGVGSSAHVEGINGIEPATGASSAYAKIGVRVPLKSYEVLITNFFEEAAHISENYVKEVYTLDAAENAHDNTNFMTASKKRVYTQSTPIQTENFPLSEHYVVENHRVLLDQAAAYRRMARQISHKRMQFSEQYEQADGRAAKQELIIKATRYLEKVIAEQLVHYWYGRAFDTQRTIITPGEEEITAINFPITLLEQMGLPLNLKSLAKKTSLEQLMHFFDADLLTSCTDRKTVRKHLLEKGIGLYLAVIEEEMVYLYHDGVDQYMIYATSYQTPTVVREFIQTVPLLDQFTQAQIGKLSDNDSWVKQWLKMDEVAN